MNADHEVMLRTLGKTGRWEGDFEAEEAVDWAVGELARLRASLARADDVATDLWVAEQRVKDVEADRDQVLAEVEELRAELARASEKEASASACAETHLAARVKAERERDAVSRKLAEVLVEPEHRRHFLCSYLWVGGGRSGSGMIDVNFAGAMTMETIFNAAKFVEDYLLRKNGVPVEVVVMGMVELEGGGE